MKETITNIFIHFSGNAGRRSINCRRFSIELPVEWFWVEYASGFQSRSRDSRGVAASDTGLQSYRIKNPKKYLK